MAIRVNNRGGCLMQTRWDFADNERHGKWSAYQQVYRVLTPPDETEEADDYDTGQALVITKNKVRGRGRALKVRFKAEPDKDLVIVGWSITNNGNGAE